MIKRGYTSTKPKPVSYLVRKGYTEDHIARYKSKNPKWKNHKVEHSQRKERDSSGIFNTAGEDESSRETDEESQEES